LTFRLVSSVPVYWIWNEVPGVGIQTEAGIVEAVVVLLVRTAAVTVVPSVAAVEVPVAVLEVCDGFR
jgi:hypothetical protein